jgi:acetyl esterase/lipase
VFDFEGGGTFYTQDDPMAHPDLVMRQLTAYRGHADPHTPLLSPLYADLHDLPPLLVQVGESELFRSSAEAFAERAAQAGVRVTFHVWPRMWHFWHLFIPWLPEARQAMTEIQQFVHALRPAPAHPDIRAA